MYALWLSALFADIAVKENICGVYKGIKGHSEINSVPDIFSFGFFRTHREHDLTIYVFFLLLHNTY